MKYCLGTVQFGLDYGVQGNIQPQEENVYKMLSFAIENGIDMLDTAAAYGDAENVLGRYIRSHPENAKKISLVSKLKPNAFENEAEEMWAEIAVRNAKGSLGRLGTDKFTAYLFHNAAYIFNEKAVAALYSVKKEGLAERVGVSIYSPDEAMKALEYPQIEAIQIPYNVFDHRLDSCGFFKSAKERGVMVFARSSLLQGLVMMDPENLPARVAFAGAYIKRFNDICQRYDLNPLEAAVGYVGSKKEINYVVFGTDNMGQLKEYVDLMNSSIPEELKCAIEEEFMNVEEKLVNPVLWK